MPYTPEQIAQKKVYELEEQLFLDLLKELHKEDEAAQAGTCSVMDLLTRPGTVVDEEAGCADWIEQAKEARNLAMDRLAEEMVQVEQMVQHVKLSPPSDEKLAMAMQEVEDFNYAVQVSLQTAQQADSPAARAPPVVRENDSPAARAAAARAEAFKNRGTQKGNKGKQ